MGRRAKLCRLGLAVFTRRSCAPQLPLSSLAISSPPAPQAARAAAPRGPPHLAICPRLASGPPGCGRARLAPCRGDGRRCGDGRAQHRAVWASGHPWRQPGSLKLRRTLVHSTTPPTANHFLVERRNWTRPGRLMHLPIVHRAPCERRGIFSAEHPCETA